ncbi:MAG TPA: hypothetical protein VH042_10155 [Solirubrobacterales bacterium]|jgi:hypothetical protein|nr:hypothetical protein [Solirubrobacterales bacterium]
MSGAGPIAVGVTPAEQLQSRPRLFAALEAALPVRFEARAADALSGLDALLVLGDGGSAPVATPAGLRSLTLALPERCDPGKTLDNIYAATDGLDPRLHGAVLPDERIGAAAPQVEANLIAEGATVLASCDGVPTWTRRDNDEAALLIPAELGPDEALRERLCDGRSAALLPLLHFLRARTEAIRWQPPAARASLLFDDPNLHWPSYGFVKLGELGTHARAHGYHVALATVPLDAWFAHPAALRALRESEGAISLLVHGNDHDGGELGRVATETDAVSLAAQARRRVEAFARRTGVAVDRVMVPPHEACSRATLSGLRRCGFEAITMTRPYPWVEFEPHSWLARPEGTGALVGWGPAEFVEGVPVLLRHPIAGRSTAELTLRAFLDQPLVLYGHHEDALGGPPALLEAVEEVNRLGPTNWCSLSEIAATSFETRRDGSRLAVRLLTRMARIEIPAGIEELTVELPAVGIEPDQQVLKLAGEDVNPGEPLAVEPGSSSEITLSPLDAIDPASVPTPRRRPLAVARRLASEGRDRLRPLAARVG